MNKLLYFRCYDNPMCQKNECLMIISSFLPDSVEQIDLGCQSGNDVSELLKLENKNNYVVPFL